MYTVIDGIPVPASGPAAFEESFTASMRATPPGMDRFQTVAYLGTGDGQAA